MKKQTYRHIVAGINANGSPDLYFVKVKCTEQELNEGEASQAAMDKAIEEGYEPKLAFDEFDSAGKAMLQLFIWESADTIEVE